MRGLRNFDTDSLDPHFPYSKLLSVEMHRNIKCFKYLYALLFEMEYMQA